MCIRDRHIGPQRIVGELERMKQRDGMSSPLQRFETNDPANNRVVGRHLWGFPTVEILRNRLAVFVRGRHAENAIPTSPLGRRSRSREHATLPTSRRGDDGSRVVLEHPTGEVAPGPRIGADHTQRRLSYRFAAEKSAAQFCHLVVGEEFLVDGLAIARRSGCETRVIEQRLCSDSPGEKRLPDSLTGECVARGCSVADEQCPRSGKWNAIDASRYWPSPVWGLCLLYTSPSPRDATLSRMPSSA